MSFVVVMSHPGLVGFQVLCSLVGFTAHRAAVLSFGVLNVTIDHRGSVPTGTRIPSQLRDIRHVLSGVVVPIRTLDVLVTSQAVIGCQRVRMCQPLSLPQKLPAWCRT